MTAKPNELGPRRRPRQRRSEETRDRILDAAVEVFTEFGYARGTTNRIAEWAEVSVGSLYQYYPNKDAIVAELVARHLDAGIAAATERRRTGMPESIGGVMRAIVGTAVGNHAHDPGFLRILMEQAPRSHELMTRVAELQHRAIGDMREILQAQPDVVVADEDAAARLVVATVDVVVHQLLAAPDPLAASVVEDEVVAMLTRYLAGG